MLIYYYIFLHFTQFVGDKIAYALSQGLKVIACVGESLEQRESGSTTDVVSAQTKAIAGTPHIPFEFLSDSNLFDIFHLKGDLWVGFPLSPVSVWIKLSVWINICEYIGKVFVSGSFSIDGKNLFFNWKVQVWKKKLAIYIKLPPRSL